MTADDRIIDPDEASQCADRKDNRQRRKSGRHKRQTNHVSLAGAPIAVEQCTSAFPIQIGRPMHARTRVENKILYQLRHASWRRISIAGSFTGKLFLGHSVSGLTVN